MSFNSLKKTLNDNKLAATLFAIAFIYMFLFTVDVPPHWESNLFIESSVNTPLAKSLIKTVQIGSEEVTASHGPINAIYYKILFSFFGYNYISYRLIKSLFFAGVILFYFLICKEFIKRRYSGAAALFVTFSFPIFIQTLVFDEGFIIGEFFKMVAIYLFISHVKLNKKGFLSYISIFIFSLLAIRTYTPTFSLVLLFCTYLLLTNIKRLKSYILLIFLIALTKLPLNASIAFGEPSYGFKLSIVYKFLFSDISRYIYSPLPFFQALYYRPLVSVVTFFGFWLFSLVLAVYIFRKKLTLFLPKYFNWDNATIDNSENNNKFAITFFISWILVELPIFFVLPEHAIRYAAGILTPLIGLFCFFCQKAEDLCVKHKKQIFFLFAVCFILAIATNIGYVTLFRATWGSSFIGADKVSEFILNSDRSKDKNSILFYHATSVAPEYITVDKNNINTYTVSQRIVPISISAEKFTYNDLIKSKNNKTEIYIVKRISSFDRSSYPNIKLDDVKDIEKITTIEGKTNMPFDRMMNFLTKLFSISYHPNIFYVYKIQNQLQETHEQV